MTEKEKILLDYCTEMANKFNLKPVRIRPMRSISKREYKSVYKKLVKEFKIKRP